jgi:nucleoside-diphosphate-sugar epimerase
VKLLLTGDRGRLGQAARASLEEAGHEVSGFDVDRGDICDAAAVRSALAGMDAVVHLAGLADDRAGAPEEVLTVNLLGTWNVLVGARAEGVGRVIYASSGKALGMLEREPDYLPVDDAHRGMPARPYGLSKWLAEEMCEVFSADTGIATICLRPVLVLDAEGYERFAGLSELPLPDTAAAWHLGVFVDVEDVAAAIVASFECPDPGHARLLLCADDIASDRPSAELAAEHLPNVPWRDGGPVPGRTALIDCSAAEELLGWKPKHGWLNRPGASPATCHPPPATPHTA